MSSSEIVKSSWNVKIKEEINWDESLVQDSHSNAFSNFLTKDLSLENERKPVVGKISFEKLTKPSTSKLIIPLRKTSSQQIKKLKKCQVCDIPGATSHYGGVVCGGCKIFFSRTVQSRKGFVCEKYGRCPMYYGKRAKCRACRFKLCLKAKMVPDEVGKLREIRTGDFDFSYHNVKREEVPLVEYFSDDYFESEINISDCRNYIQSFLDSDLFSSDLDILDLFENMEKSCDNHMALKMAKFFPKHCSIKMSLEDAILLPMPICDKIPMDYLRELFLDDPKTYLKLNWCRHVHHFLEWTSSFQDLSQLNMTKRNELIQVNMTPIMILVTSYGFFNYSRKKDTSSVWENVIKNFQHAEYYIQVIDAHIMKRFQEMNITFKELIILKCILLFNGSEITSEDEEIVRCYRLRYCDLLRNYVKSRIDDTNEAVKRIDSLMELTRTLRKMAFQFNNLMTTCFAQNSFELHGNLVYDFHVRQRNSTESIEKQDEILSDVSESIDKRKSFSETKENAKSGKRVHENSAQIKD